MSYDNELYQQVILDHNRKPRNFHEMENPTNTVSYTHLRAHET